MTVIAWSAMVGKTLTAAAQLAKENIDVEVVDPRGIRPFDFEAVSTSIRKTGRVLLVHEAPTVGGPAGEVAAMIAEKLLGYLEAPIVRVGGADVPMPQSVYLEPYAIPQVLDIANAARALLGRPQLTES